MDSKHWASALEMREFWYQQRVWSYETFGPPEVRGPVGPLKHLEKEAKEAYSETDPMLLRKEIADCLFLVFDSAHRAGMTFGELSAVCFAKLAENKARQWPDWRSADPNAPVEHNRKGDGNVG